MIVAITGGTGFIGRYLIARHLGRGDEVRYLTRNNSKPIAGATAIVGDLMNFDSLQILVENADVLYHCAAELHDVEKMHATNVLGTENLLKAARGQVKRWVQLSSTGVYGVKPMQDVDEDIALNPANAYEISKAKADELVINAMNDGALYGLILRPSNVYGVDMPNQSLFQLIKMVKRGWFFFIGSKRSVVNYIHVENVVDALLLCATTKIVANGRVYIVSDWCYLDELIAMIATALNVSCPNWHVPENLVRLLARVGDVLPRFPLRSSRVDALTYQHRYKTDRISTELNFCSHISMTMGISELCKNLK